MNEILYRGKRTDTGEWVYGYYIGKQKMVGKTAHWILDINDRFHEIHYRSIDPDTLGVFTDSIDENGKKIFEGDICVVKESKEFDYVTVGFEHGAFVIYPVNGRITEKTMWDIWYNDFSIKVIGNIHDFTMPSKNKHKEAQHE